MLKYADWKDTVSKGVQLVRPFIQPGTWGIGKLIPDNVVKTVASKVSKPFAEGAVEAGRQALQDNTDKFIRYGIGYAIPTIGGAATTGLITNWLVRNYNKRQKNQEDKLPTGILTALATLGGGALGAYLQHQYKFASANTQVPGIGRGTTWNEFRDSDNNISKQIQRVPPPVTTVNPGKIPPAKPIPLQGPQAAQKTNFWNPTALNVPVVQPPQYGSQKGQAIG